MSSSSPHRVRDAALLAVVGFAAAALLVGASARRDQTFGDRFDLLRWERLTLAGKVLTAAGAPFRHDASPDEALARYFRAPPGSSDRAHLENAAEAALAGRIDATLEAAGVRGRIPVPGSVFPPVDFELAAAPRVLVESPRTVIERRSTELLRPGIDAAGAASIEQDVEAHDSTVSALVVASGGVAAFPAIVADGNTYADTLAAAAHEWTHHYLTFYPLGAHYFDNQSTAALNETVADLVGNEVARLALARWGDLTPNGFVPVPASTPGPSPRRTPAVDANATLRDLRKEVDSLLAAGKVTDAEARMEAVRLQLAASGVRIRRLNQAYFAWYGTYAARPDSIDPVGAQLREIRQRAGSLAAFLQVIGGITSRAEVQRQLDAMRARGG